MKLMHLVPHFYFYACFKNDANEMHSCTLPYKTAKIPVSGDLYCLVTFDCGKYFP